MGSKFENFFDKCSWFFTLQLVFGFNPKLSNIFTNRLPALEEPNISKLVADNLRSARKAFVASESSEKTH